MRFLLGRDPGDCSTCGATLVRGASWCGSCGAPATTPVEEHQVDDGPPPPPVEPSRGRKYLPVVLVLALLGGLVTAGLTRTPPPEVLLGTQAALSGQSATGPPPGGLRLAWQHRVPVPDQTSYRGGLGITARDGLLGVDGDVIDLGTGRVVRSTTWGSYSGVRIDGEELIRVDELTGEITRLGPLPEEVRGHAGWISLATDESILLSDGRTATLVRVDGTVVQDVPGDFVSYLDRAVDGPAVLPVRDIEAYVQGTVHLVAADDGRVVATIGGPGERVVDVVGDTVLVSATTSDRVGLPGGGVDWEISLRDPDDGAELAAGTVRSADAPRLLGVLDDTALVATRSGVESRVWLLEQGAPVARLLVTYESPRSIAGDPFEHAQGGPLAGAAVVGELVALLDEDAGAVRAIDLTGRTVWSTPAEDADVLSAAGGVVAVTRQEGGVVRVLDGLDGSHVVTVPPVANPWGGRHPAAVVGDSLVLSDNRPWIGGLGGVPIASSTWLDVRSGAVVPIDEAIEPFRLDDESVPPAWLLHGITTDESGLPVPVATRGVQSQTLQVLDPGSGFRTIDLGRTGDGVVGYYLQVTGFTNDHLVVLQEHFEGPTPMTTWVVERGGGPTWSREGVAAFAALGDVLLATRFAPDSFDSFETDGFVALDVATGEELWHSDAEDFQFFGGHVAGDADVAAAVDDLGVRLLSLRDGVVAWEWPAAEVLASSQLVLGSEQVVVATTAGEVVALDRVDASERWRTELGAPLVSMTGAGDHVLMGTIDGLVVHLDERGREVQRIAVGNGAVTSVASLGDTVVAVVDGLVVGLRADASGIVRQDEVPLP